MNKSLPTRTLRAQPDLDQLKRQAKELLQAFRSAEPAAVAEVTAHFHDADTATFALHDAQLVLARAYGFESWPKLKAFVDGVTIARLAEVVRSGDLEQARAMLNVRPELARMCIADDDEHLALHYAVIARQPELVRLLIKHGADPRQGIYPHRDATTALTLATDRGYDEIAAIIREEERNGPETLRTDTGRPPLPPELIAAAQGGDQARMIALLEQNPWVVGITPQHGLMTLVHVAAANLWDQVLVWLLDHGADVNTRIEGGPSPLELVGCGNITQDKSPERIAAVVTLLRSRGAELTPRAAVAYGEADQIRALHAAGKLVNGLPKNQGYRGLLEMAVTHIQTGIVKLLLDLGFDPDEVLRKGDTGEFIRGGPLRECVRTGRHAIAGMLLAHGATLTPPVAVILGKGDWLRAQHAAGKLENPPGEGEGLLSIAVKNNRPDMLALLLDLSLDPDERVRQWGQDEVPFYSSGGALYSCASSGKLAMAEMLLTHGADPNMHVYASGPPLFKAYEAHDTAMIALLEKHGGVVDASTAGCLRLTDKARQLLEDPAEGHAPTLLFYACDGGDPEIVRMALERIDWPKQDPRWHGILVRSLGDHSVPDRERHAACFRQVLDRCDPSIPGKSGRTILHDLVRRLAASLHRPGGAGGAHDDGSGPQAASECPR